MELLPTKFCKIVSYDIRSQDCGKDVPAQVHVDADAKEFQTMLSVECCMTVSTLTVEQLLMITLPTGCECVPGTYYLILTVHELISE